MSNRVDVRELAWAAGLFEGEGCVRFRSAPRTTRLYPHLTLASTDGDTVERFHRAVGGLGAVYPGTTTRSGKPMYAWNVTKFESAQAVIAMLWYGLGERRRDRCAEVLRACAEARS